MEYKILEANGVENENVDGAAFNNFCSGGKDYVMRGVLNECLVYSPSSNSIGISTGEIVIQGFRVKLLSPYFHSFTDTPSSPVQYFLIARIDLSSNRDVQFELTCTANNELTKENLYKTEKGVYEIIFATFTYSPEGVTGITQQIPVGFPSGSGSGLPGVTPEDNGKILMVENGMWKLVKIATAEDMEV